VIAEWLAKRGQPGRQKAIGLALLEQEEEALTGMLAAADGIIEDMHDAGSALHVAGAPNIPLLKPQALYWRLSAAKNKWQTAAYALTQGFSEGNNVRFPPWQEPVPKSAAVLATKAQQRVRNKEEKEQQKARAEQLVQATMDRMESVILPASHEMLQSGDVGAGKADLGWEIIERYGQHGNNRFGFMPVNIFKNDAEERTFIGRSARRYVQLVDGPQFLQAEPSMPAGTIRSLVTVTRAVIMMYSRMMDDRHCGQLVCMDSGHVTWLRSIVHEKRGKVGAAGKIQEAQFSTLTATTELDSTLPMLLRSKEGFYPRFLQELQYQLLNPDHVDGWDPLKVVGRGRFLAFVMPAGTTSAVLVASDSGRVQYRGASITAKDLQVWLDGTGDESIVAKQGQGEAMLFKAMLRWIGMLWALGGASLAAEACFDLVCQDVDALSGYLMPCVHSIITEFDRAGQTNVCATLRILLTVRSKDDRKLERLGLLSQQKSASRCIGAATGDLLKVVVDALAMYLAMEADDAAPTGAAGTRAIGCTSAILSIGANDVKSGLKGIGYSKLFAAFFSRRFREYANGQQRDDVVLITPPTSGNVVTTREPTSCSFRLSHWTVGALLYTIFSELPEIVSQMSNLYTKSKMDDMSQRLAEGFDNYTVLWAAAVVAVRPVALPTHVELVAFTSHTMTAFDQFSNWLGQSSPRPATAAEEVHRCSYRLSSARSVELQYSVMMDRPGWRTGPATVPGTPAFFEEQYGDLCSAAPVEPLFSSASEAIKAAWERGKGVEPTRTVPMQLVVAAGTIMYAADVESLRTFTGERYARCRTEGVVLVKIARATIAQHTKYMLRSHNKLDSKTVEEVATNGGGWTTSDDTEPSTATATDLDPEDAFRAYVEDVVDSESSTDLDAIVSARASKLQTLFATLTEGPGNDLANPAPAFTTARDALVQLLSVVVLSAVSRASSNDEGDASADP
jgi:hypothetical protein